MEEKTRPVWTGFKIAVRPKLKTHNKNKLYSECPKSGRPDFGIFETCPVPKSSGCLKSGQLCPVIGHSVG